MYTYKDLKIGQLFEYNEANYNLVLEVVSINETQDQVTTKVLSANEETSNYRPGDSLTQGAFSIHWNDGLYKLKPEIKIITINKSRFELLDNDQ